MKLLFDFFPILAFFIAYKLFGLYIATGTAMLMSILQVIIYRIKYNRFETIHLVGLALILLLGGATLFFKNPLFIKWKPTGIYWATALVFFFSSFINKRPLVQKMMEGNINLPNPIWLRLNNAWAVFFIILGTLNLYVAYYYTTDVWVNFKLFGGTGLTLLFVFAQALYLTRHLVERPIAPGASN